MYELLAFSAEDGYAFVCNNEGIYHVRPPYKADDWSVSTEDEVEHSVVRLGYEVGERYGTWKEIKEYINSQVKKARECANC